MEERMTILQGLLDAVDGADRVTLDLTHGFRHLPMLDLLCVLFLEQACGIRVEAIYFGALEMTGGGVTPMLRVDGLLHMARWLQAHTYDKDGDYGVFRPLFEAEGRAQATLLNGMSVRPPVEGIQGAGRTARDRAFGRRARQPIQRNR